MKTLLRETVLPISVFVGGIACGRTGLILPEKADDILLLVLILFVGISLGANPSIGKLMKMARPRMLAVPLTVMAGTALGNIVLSLLPVGLSLKESLLIGAGYGYYSLSSMIISGYGLKELGTVALLTNIIREVMTLAFAGLMVKYFGKSAPILSGGATSMDITLPVVIRYSGEEYALVSIFSGIFLTLAVPVVITVILSI